MATALGKQNLGHQGSNRQKRAENRLSICHGEKCQFFPAERTTFSHDQNHSVKCGTFSQGDQNHSVKCGYFAHSKTYNREIARKIGTPGYKTKIPFTLTKPASSPPTAPPQPTQPQSPVDRHYGVPSSIQHLLPPLVRAPEAPAAPATSEASQSAGQGFAEQTNGQSSSRAGVVQTYSPTSMAPNTSVRSRQNSPVGGGGRGRLGTSTGTGMSSRPSQSVSRGGGRRTGMSGAPKRNTLPRPPAH